MLQNKIRLHVKYLLNAKGLEIIWSSFLLLILIIIKSAITVIIRLIYGKHRKFWKSKFWNCSKYKWSLYLNEIAHFNLHPIINVTIKLIRVFDKRNKTTRLPLLIPLSPLSDINTTLKIGITITCSFTLHYVITTTSLWC